MSTRCHIALYKSKQQRLSKPSVLIYRHSDGYPEGVLPEIMPFLKKWDKIRGMSDIEYLGARLLQHLTNIYDQWSPSDPSSGILGYGISWAFHWDIEYLYAIYSDGEVRVYETEWEEKLDDKKKPLKVLQVKRDRQNSNDHSLQGLAKTGS